MSSAERASAGAGETTAALVARLKQRAEVRAERSVQEALPTGPAANARTHLGTQVVVDELSNDAPSVTQSNAEPRDDSGASQEYSPRPLHGPAGRLELYGEPIVKLTLDLPLALVDGLARWERDETVATRQRVYRERLIDCALASMPEDVDTVLTLTRAVPVSLRGGEREQVGTRVRASIHRRFQSLRPELRVRRVRDIYLRDIYSAALLRYLAEIGIQVEGAFGREDTLIERPAI